MLKRLVFAALAAGSVEASAATINLNSGDVVTLSPNTTTTVTCDAGGTGGAAATASYGCDSSTNLTIDIVSAQAQETTKSTWLGNESTCQATAQLLSQNRSRINQTTVVAMCDSSTNLVRFALMPTGAINPLQTTWIGNQDSCLAQAKAIDGGR